MTKPLTKDERDGFIEFAKQAGMIQDGEVWFSPSYENCDVYTVELLFFAKLVAEKEREACALIADEAIDFWVQRAYPESAEVRQAQNIAESIRARGQA